MKPFAGLLFLASLTAACGSSDTSEPVGGSIPDSISDSVPVSVPESVGPDPTVPDEPLGTGPYPVGTIDVTITHPDADDVTYAISCLGDTATVTGDVPISAEQACAALADDNVQSRLVFGVPTDMVCTEIYGGPDLAMIVGDLDGEPVGATVDRNNGCGIDDWDRLLADILPPALGIEPST